MYLVISCCEAVTQVETLTADYIRDYENGDSEIFQYNEDTGNFQTLLEVQYEKDQVIDLRFDDVEIAEPENDDDDDDESPDDNPED